MMNWFFWQVFKKNYLENLMACFVLVLFSKYFFLVPDCIAQKEGYFYNLLDSRQLCSQKIKQRLWLEAVEAVHASNIPPQFQETTVVDNRKWHPLYWEVEPCFKKINKKLNMRCITCTAKTKAVNTRPYCPAQEQCEPKDQTWLASAP